MAPGAPETLAKGRGRSPIPFARVSKAPGANQTSKITYFLSLKQKTTKPRCSHVIDWAHKERLRPRTNDSTERDAPDIRHRAVWHGVECYTCLPKGFTLLPGTPKPVAPNTMKTHRFLQKQRTARGNDPPPSVAPPPQRICKVPWRWRGAPFFEKTRPQILPRRLFGVVKHMVFGVTVFCPTF